MRRRATQLLRALAVHCNPRMRSSVVQRHSRGVEESGSGRRPRSAGVTSAPPGSDRWQAFPCVGGAGSRLPFMSLAPSALIQSRSPLLLLPVTVGVQATDGDRAAAHAAARGAGPQRGPRHPRALCGAPSSLPLRLRVRGNPSNSEGNRFHSEGNRFNSEGLHTFADARACQAGSLTKVH